MALPVCVEGLASETGQSRASRRCACSQSCRRSAEQRGVAQRSRPRQPQPSRWSCGGGDTVWIWPYGIPLRTAQRGGWDARAGHAREASQRTRGTLWAVARFLRSNASARSRSRITKIATKPIDPIARALPRPSPPCSSADACPSRRISPTARRSDR
eukprot:scaffold79047_cov64-Phaeocystis_antarctica.AAC.1